MKLGSHTHDIPLLILRIAAGIIFMAHGWQKVNNMEGTVNFFVGLNLPAFVAYLVAYAELIGGAMLIVGLFTSYVAVVLTIIMATALFYVKGGAVFRTFNVSVFEIDLALLAITLTLALKGSGSIAVKPSGCCCCGNGTCEVGSGKAEPTVEYPQNNN